MTRPDPDQLDPRDVHAFRSHPRRFQGSNWVYPVLSRRSRGISVGVNINPDKNCNFNCIYCQVDRSSSAPPAPSTPFSLPAFEAELRATLGLITSDRIY